MSIDILTSAWYGDRRLSVHFPSDWRVTPVSQQYRRALTGAEIEERLGNPIGSPRLAELAKGKKRVAILVDDIQRPTPVGEIMPFLIDELKSSGIERDNIVIVMATACHRRATEEDFIKKLGRDIASTFHTSAHECTEDLTYLGETSKGTPIYVNRLAAECDLRIGVSGVYPNRGAAFGGGSKIIHPGICGVETARHMHDSLKGAARGGSLLNEFRTDIEEIAGRVGLDFAVNILLNEQREISYISAGDRMISHRTAVEAAKRFYYVTPADDADIVVTNIYPFDTSLHFISKGLWPFSHGKDAASKVVIASCPEGLGYHALSLASGRGLPGLFRRMRALSRHDLYRFVARLRGEDRGFLLLSPYAAQSDLRKIYATSRAFSSWDPLIRCLRSRHEGSDVKVAVYTCAPLQVPACSI